MSIKSVVNGHQAKRKVRVVQQYKVSCRNYSHPDPETNEVFLLEEWEEDRERVVFKGSYNAYRMWKRTHAVLPGMFVLEGFCGETVAETLSRKHREVVALA
jgi:hypothetical protein